MGAFEGGRSLPEIEVVNRDANSPAIFIPQGFGESGNGLLSSNHWGTEAGKNGWELRRTGSSGFLHTAKVYYIEGYTIKFFEIQKVVL